MKDNTGIIMYRNSVGGDNLLLALIFSYRYLSGFGQKVDCKAVVKMVELYLKFANLS